MYNDRFNIRNRQCRAERLGTYIISVRCESNHSIFYSVANAPTITSLQLTGPGTLRVEWSPPVGGASVVGYTIHYTDNDGNIGTESTNADSTSVDISGLCDGDGVMYTVTVEATSEHLSGVSESMNGIGGRFTSLL